MATVFIGTTKITQSSSECLTKLDVKQLKGEGTARNCGGDHKSKIRETQYREHTVLWTKASLSYFEIQMGQT